MRFSKSRRLLWGVVKGSTQELRKGNLCFAQCIRNCISYYETVTVSWCGHIVRSKQKRANCRCQPSWSIIRSTAPLRSRLLEGQGQNHMWTPKNPYNVNSTFYKHLMYYYEYLLDQLLNILMYQFGNRIILFYKIVWLI